ncbi:hypothetical protein MHU86_6193 [Fragilaria crotonensis]|nr:hypothetical protein MHU86_6193 [Fragilaria crotonensis]
MCFWWFCSPSSGRNAKVRTGDNKSEALVFADPQEQQDYEDLQHVARKREIKVTIRKGTQAGVAAGLSVMAGVIVAGPVGAVVGGAVGTAMAARIAKNVVSLNELLDQTPPMKRREVLRAFHESFKEEFLETITNNPELKLLMGGASIFGVVRYMVDRELLQNDQLERLDRVLKHVV